MVVGKWTPFDEQKILCTALYAHAPLRYNMGKATKHGTCMSLFERCCRVMNCTETMPFMAPTIENPVDPVPTGGWGMRSLGMVLRFAW